LKAMASLGSAISLMWSAFWPVFLGVVGWFVASFFGRPYLDFLSLRSQVQEEIIFTGNVGPMTAHSTADYEKAVGSLRRLGAKMQAMDVSAQPPRWFLSLLGFDLAKAGRNLIGLSNALTDDGRVLHVDKIEVALNLPRSSTDDYLQHIVEQKRKPHI
jgi:hypothetical protein